MRFDIPRAQAARVHRDDLVLEATPAPLVLRHDLRLEAPVSIPRHRDFHRSAVSLHRFPALAVAVVATPAAFRLPFLVAEMMAQLGIHRSLQQRLRQLLQQPIRPYDLFRLLSLEQLIECSIQFSCFFFHSVLLFSENASYTKCFIPSPNAGYSIASPTIACSMCGSTRFLMHGFRRLISFSASSPPFSYTSLKR